MKVDSSSSNCRYDIPPSWTVATNCSHGTLVKVANGLSPELVALREVLRLSVVSESLFVIDPIPEEEDDSVELCELTDEVEIDLGVLVATGTGNLHLVRKLS